MHSSDTRQCVVYKKSQQGSVADVFHIIDQNRYEPKINDVNEIKQNYIRTSHWASTLTLTCCSPDPACGLWVTQEFQQGFLQFEHQVEPGVEPEGSSLFGRQGSCVQNVANCCCSHYLIPNLHHLSQCQNLTLSCCPPLHPSSHLYLSPSLRQTMCQHTSELRMNLKRVGCEYRAVVAKSSQSISSLGMMKSLTRDGEVVESHAV